MTASSMRRLAKDQASLRTSTPPNYLFPDGDDSLLPDDLTQLIILITGAQGTPYSQGLWKLHLRMPEDYPINPPKATFKTRIFHPNVDETTGTVCLETLKRDWESKLTLKDILITISCLLINPNPDSALNSDAGSLLQEDYDAFARKAKLMTSIHASIPKALHDAVLEAKRRGEDEGVVLQAEKEERPAASRVVSSSTSIVMKSKAVVETSRPSSSHTHTLSEDDEQEDDMKENDPWHLPPSPSKPLLSPRKVLGKRTLSDIPTSVEVGQLVSNVDDYPVKVSTETNPNAKHIEGSSEPLKKSPKLTQPVGEVSATPLINSDEALKEGAGRTPRAVSTVNDKENIVAAPKTNALEVKKTADAAAMPGGPARPTLRKVSNVGSSRGKCLPRVGIRRL